MPENTTDTVWTVRRWHGAGTHPAGTITWENPDALGPGISATSCPIRLPEGFALGNGARIRVIVEVIEDQPATIGEAWTWRDLPGEACRAGMARAFGASYLRTGRTFATITRADRRRVETLANEWLAEYLTGTSPTDEQLTDVRRRISEFLDRTTSHKIAPTIDTATADL